MTGVIDKTRGRVRGDERDRPVDAPGSGIGRFHLDWLVQRNSALPKKSSHQEAANGVGRARSMRGGSECLESSDRSHSKSGGLREGAGGPITESLIPGISGIELTRTPGDATPEPIDASFERGVLCP